MCLYPRTIITRPKDGDAQTVQVSCGKCLQCLQQKSIEWAYRIMDECKNFCDNAFLTLTYNNDNLPEDCSVSRREVQLFMKRLRKQLKVQVRFFACGEYGRRFGRPHYHLIIFGWFPDDIVFLKTEGKDILYRSPFLEKIWTKGFSSVGKVTYDTALYCAKYMNKFQFDEFKNKTKLGSPVCPPFIQMSNRPGIGYNSVYSSDLVSDRIYHAGRGSKIPRYYLKVMERDGIDLDDFKSRRQLQGAIVSQSKNIEFERKKYKDKFGKIVVLRD